MQLLPGGTVKSMKKFYSKEVIDQVSQISAIQYLMDHETYNLKRTGRSYITKKHDSLYLSNGFWRWSSRGIGGKTALSYLQKVDELSFIDAMDRLCYLYRIDSEKKDPDAAGRFAEEQKKRKAEIEAMVEKAPSEFALPPPAENNKRVYAYLRKRGISGSVISYCLKHKLIYQEEEHGNVVFVGYDNDGQARYAGLRSTGYKQFKGDATGSRKDYSFRITNDTAGEAHLFEAAIDLLSYATLMEMHNLDFRSVNLCALAGVAVPGAGGTSEIPPAIRTLLDGRKIDTIYFHLDNDEVGIASAKALATALKERGYKTFIQPVPKERGKDVNDMLKSILAEKGQEYDKGKKM